MQRRVQGITLIGLLFTITVLIILGIFIMRVVPVYIENYEIKSSIKSLTRLDPAIFTGDDDENIVTLKQKLINQFDTNGITIKPEDIQITPIQPGNYQVLINYDITKGLVGNVGLLFHFHESTEVTIGPK